jgi:hypothetical protein
VEQAFMPALTCHTFSALAAEVPNLGTLTWEAAPGALFKDCSSIHSIWAMYSSPNPGFFSFKAQRRSVRSNQSGRKVIRMYILPRVQALKIGCVLFVASLSIPLSAQTARIHSNGQQANLRIEVKVVRAVAVHHPDKDKDEDKDKDRGGKDTAVSYNLNPRHEEFSVSEEQRSMLVGSGKTFRQEQVRAITIVPK